MNTPPPTIAPVQSVAGEEDPGAALDIPPAQDAPQAAQAHGERPCPACGGSGQIGASPCATCDGTGKVILDGARD